MKKGFDTWGKCRNCGKHDFTVIKKKHSNKKIKQTMKCNVCGNKEVIC